MKRSKICLEVGVLEDETKENGKRYNTRRDSSWKFSYIERYETSDSERRNQTKSIQIYILEKLQHTPENL